MQVHPPIDCSSQQLWCHPWIPSFEHPTSGLSVNVVSSASEIYPVPGDFSPLPCHHPSAGPLAVSLDYHFTFSMSPCSLLLSLMCYSLFPTLYPEAICEHIMSAYDSSAPNPSVLPGLPPSLTFAHWDCVIWSQATPWAPLLLLFLCSAPDTLTSLPLLELAKHVPKKESFYLYFLPAEMLFSQIQCFSFISFKSLLRYHLIKECFVDQYPITLSPSFAVLFFLALFTIWHFVYVFFFFLLCNSLTATTRIPVPWRQRFLSAFGHCFTFKTKNSTWHIIDTIETCC